MEMINDELKYPFKIDSVMIHPFKPLEGHDLFAAVRPLLATQAGAREVFFLSCGFFTR